MGRSSDKGSFQDIGRSIDYRIENHRGIRNRCERVQGIRQQGIIPIILVLAKHAIEGVPVVLAYANLGDVIGISPVAEIAEVEVVEKRRAMVERPKFRGEARELWALLQIDHGVVGCLAAVHW